MELGNQEIKLIIESLNVIIYIIIAGVGVYGVKQIHLMKSDIKLRSERAAKEKAIEAANRYLTKYTKLIGEHSQECREKDIAIRLPSNVDNFFIDEIGDKEFKTVLKRYKLESWLEGLNELESISAMFVSGVADEETGFKIIGYTFCNSVRSNYDLIAFSRSRNSVDYWDNIVKLYKVWSKRLEKLDLQANKKNLDQKIKNIDDQRISPIGPSLN